MIHEQNSVYDDPEYQKKLKALKKNRDLLDKDVLELLSAAGLDLEDNNQEEHS